MFKQIAVLVLAALILSSLTCSASEEKRVYPCYRLTTEPVIDGRIRNDPAWENIPEEAGFVLLDSNTPASKQTFFKIGYYLESTENSVLSSYYAEAFYIGIKCEEPEIKKIKAKLKDGENLCTEDSIEIFIFPEGAENYYQFVVNAIGSRWSGMGQKLPLSSLSLEDWQASTYKGKDYWSMEIRVPFKIFALTPKSGEVWTGNIARNILTPQGDRYGDRYTTWAHLSDGFHDLENFGKIVFKDKSLSIKEVKSISMKRKSIYLRKKISDSLKILSKLEKDLFQMKINPFLKDYKKIKIKFSMWDKLSIKEKELLLNESKELVFNLDAELIELKLHHSIECEIFVCRDYITGGEVAMKLDVLPAGNPDLRLNLDVTAGENTRVEAGDQLVLGFREIFSGRKFIHKLSVPSPVAAAGKASWPLRFAGGELDIGPGAYHLTAELFRGGKSLCASRVGSVFFCVAEPSESLRYVTANYQMAFLDFLFDPETGSVLSAVPPPARIPATLDPANPSTRMEWVKSFQQNAPKGWEPYVQKHRKEKTYLELIADGGQGILFAMIAYQAMGDEVRRQYAHRAFDRFVCERVFDKGLFRGPQQQIQHFVAVVCQACILLHKDPKYGSWAEKTLSRLGKWLTKYQKGELTHYCGQDPGVYTGRIFSGRAFYQIARWLFSGKPDTEAIDNIVHFAVKESEFLVKHNGHYINRGGDWLKKCANMNMARGLAAALHLARQTGQKEAAEKIAEGLQGVIYAASSYNSRPVNWMRTDAYITCVMALRMLGKDAVIETYQRDCVPVGDYVPLGAHRWNAVGAMVLNTPEYRRAVEKTGRQWRLLVDFDAPQGISVRP